MMAYSALGFMLSVTVAIGHRVADDAREKLQVTGEHAEGLEAEHSFEVVSKGTRESSGSAWSVNAQDEAIIAKLMTKLNVPGADSQFTWRDDQDHWTFGLVKLTAQTAKGSLALHMLHRHGLASLLASRAASHFSSSVVASEAATWNILEQYVQTAEEFAEIRELRELLENLSLSGLRNLHSFDHQWSVRNFAGEVPGCSQMDAGACILQAGASKTAYDFLVNHGFVPSATKEVEARMGQVMSALSDGTSGLHMRTYSDFLTPLHTGKKNLNMNLTGFGTDHYLSGDVLWEGGGVSQGLNIPISWDTYNQIRQASSFEAAESLKEAALQRCVEQLTHAHKSFMEANRLVIWTHETAEFSQMYPRLAAYYQKRSQAGRRKDNWLTSWFRSLAK